MFSFVSRQSRVVTIDQIHQIKSRCRSHDSGIRYFSLKPREPAALPMIADQPRGEHGIVPPQHDVTANTLRSDNGLVKQHTHVATTNRMTRLYFAEMFYGSTGVASTISIIIGAFDSHKNR